MFPGQISGCPAIGPRPTGKFETNLLELPKTSEAQAPACAAYIIPCSPRTLLQAYFHICSALPQQFEPVLVNGSERPVKVAEEAPTLGETSATDVYSNFTWLRCSSSSEVSASFVEQT
jgi:hypothetical protein